MEALKQQLLELARTHPTHSPWWTGQSEVRRHGLLHHVQVVEKALGFPLPELLKFIYVEIDLDGFGPGVPGMYCLPEVAVTFHAGHSIVDHYLCQRGTQEIGYPEWPEGLLPVCEWPNSMTTSVNCLQAPYPVIRSDPNLDMSDNLRTLLAEKTGDRDQFGFLEQHGSLAGCSWVESVSLEQWLTDWLNGKDIFRTGNPVY